LLASSPAARKQTTAHVDATQGLLVFIMLLHEQPCGLFLCLSNLQAEKHISHVAQYVRVLLLNL
jgi:hypothetical protein